MVILNIYSGNNIVHDLLGYLYPGSVMFLIIYGIIADMRRRKIKKAILNKGIQVEADLINVNCVHAGTDGFVCIIIELSFKAKNGQAVSMKKEAVVFLSELNEIKSRKSISIKYLKENPNEIIFVEILDYFRLMQKRKDLVRG